MKKTLLLLFILTGLSSHAQVVAVRDTFTVLQASLDTFDLVQNDTFPAGDSVCISLLDSNTRFTLLDCRRVVYSADSFHTGVDSVRHVVCDTAMACDTNAVFILISADTNLLPQALFAEDTANNFGPYPQWSTGLFGCTNSFQGVNGWQDYVLFNTSYKADSIYWTVFEFNTGNYPYLDTFARFRGDTLIYYPAYYGYPQTIAVCITALNRYGSTTHCDSSCNLIYEGIKELPLSNISIYPAPASRQLTIDMSQNTDAITSQYSGIDLINMLGQNIKNIPRSGNSKRVQLNVADLPEGIYNATITDATGETRMLGRFTIER